MRIDKNNYDVFEKASKITMTRTGIRWFDKENIDGYIDQEDVISTIEDLICEVERLEEKIEDIIADRNDNYKPISSFGMYG
jgi:cell division septum initiation protein DivIVA